MAQWLFRVLKGAFIGVGAILPGISGGVLMVVLGVYRPIMAFLAHPVREFKRHALFLLPVLIGAAVGVVLLARVVDWLFRTSETPAVWLFIGLVVGTLPSLYREAGEQGRGAKAWLALALGAALMGGWMYLLARQGMQVTPNIAWWAFAGVLWGLGFLVPGMSPSSFFIFFGLYQPMTEALGRLDFAVLLPMGIGLLATVGLLARGMNALLHKAYPVVMHAILGVVIASTVAIMPFEASASPGVLLYVGCFLLGCAAALGMDLLGKRMKK